MHIRRFGIIWDNMTYTHDILYYVVCNKWVIVVIDCLECIFIGVIISWHCYAYSIFHSTCTFHYIVILVQEIVSQGCRECQVQGQIQREGSIHIPAMQLNHILSNNNVYSMFFATLF